MPQAAMTAGRRGGGEGMSMRSKGQVLLFALLLVRYISIILGSLGAIRHHAAGDQVESDGLQASYR
jgi:hypothetical protein